MRAGPAAGALTFDAFDRCLEAFGIVPARSAHAALMAAYAEAGRHYHDTSHIAACLTHFDRYRPLARRPHEIELALWFHDAVYDPRRKDNEARSAQWAERFLTGHGGEAAATARVRDMILATRTHVPEGDDAALMIDIDLGILGTPEPVFEAYDRAIRREYHFVPEAEYRARRADVLEGFLARDAIYRTGEIRGAWEARARRNLASKIAELRDLS